jgi:hypothetical protein
VQDDREERDDDEHANDSRERDLRARYAHS